MPHTGVGTYISEIIGNLNGDVFECFLIADHNEFTIPKNMWNLEIPIFRVPLRREIHPYFDIMAIVKTIQILVKEKPDVIHAHLGHADWIGLLAAKGLRSLKVCTIHNVWFKWDWKDKFIFIIYRMIIKFTEPDSIIAVSRSIAEHINKVYNVEARKIILIPNAIPKLKLTYNKQSIRNKLSIKTREKIILFVGRLSVQKSVDVLIKAINIVKNDIDELKLILIGDGTRRSDLERMTSQYGIEKKVCFLGTIMDPYPYFFSADLFVLPSAFEGLPTVILEAFQLGLPVLASQIDGVNDLIIDGENGMLFEPGNSNDRANKIKKFFLMEDHSNLIRKAKEDFVSKHTIEKYVDSQLKIYNLGK
jgi:glycosyltransferase involved in cell wall biosynthesis